MKGRVKVRIGLLVTALGAVMLAALPAGATTGAASLTGTGTISPGLTETGGAQSFTYSGTGVIAADTSQGLLSCTWTGNDSIGTLEQGAGSLSGSCSTPQGSATLSGSYVRTGVVVTIDGSWVGAGVAGLFTAGCTFTGTTIAVPPIPPSIKGFALWCVIWW